MPELPIVTQQGRAAAAQRRQAEAAAARKEQEEEAKRLQQEQLLKKMATQNTEPSRESTFMNPIGNNRPERPIERLNPLPPPTQARTQAHTEDSSIKGAPQKETMASVSDSKPTAAPVLFDKQLNSKGDDDHQRRKECPVSVMTDSYKSTHLLMYPKVDEMRAYGEFRKPFPDMGDDRIVVYGIRYYIDNFIKHVISDSDISQARTFLPDHLILSEVVKGRNYFKENPTEGDPTTLNYLDLLKRNKGRFPVKIEAMPEGSVIRPHIPAFIITAKKEYSRLCTFLETLLTMIWYPSCVATLSRHTRNLIETAFQRSVDDDFEDYNLKLHSRLHDFGFRGCTSVEQSVIGGCAHLLSFAGSDTMSACYYAQHVLNKGVPVGFSIPATEHSVMTSWEDELKAIENLCEKFAGGMVSAVLDAYDYHRAALPKRNCHENTVYADCSTRFRRPC
jgi:nicotinic acid phosphoribosyltransferase